MVATSYHGPSAAAAPNVVVSDARPAPVASEFGVVKLFPTQMRFVTGVARGYEDDFPPELGHVVKEEDFQTAINQINNTLKDYWPCLFCICMGYACCPCTAGISLLCPNLCIKDAEQYVRSLIQRINKRTCFARAGVEWSLVRSCGRSWIEISYPLAKRAMIMTYQQSTLEEAMASSGQRGGSYSNQFNARASAASPLVVEV